MHAFQEKGRALTCASHCTVPAAAVSSNERVCPIADRNVRWYKRQSIKMEEVMHRRLYIRTILIDPALEKLYRSPQVLA